MVLSSEALAAQLLAARRSLRGSDLDSADLDHFVQVLCRIEVDRHGFAAADLIAIERAWVGAAGEAWSGGFVARLKDGRRVHADGRAGPANWSEDSDVDAGVLDPGEALPELGPRHGWQGHVWDDGVARTLNEFLARMA